MNDEMMDKILEVIIFASALSEQKFKKDIVDVKEKAAAVKEIVTDNMETIQSINDV